jgi:hypothetical protein
MMICLAMVGLTVSAVCELLSEFVSFHWAFFSLIISQISEVDKQLQTVWHSDI